MNDREDVRKNTSCRVGADVVVEILGSENTDGECRIGGGGGHYGDGNMLLDIWALTDEHK